jgi:superfamily II DNA or RNA helicase
MSAFVPRDYQLAGRDAARNHPTGLPGGLIVSATGTGKTRMAHMIAADFIERGERVFWLTHRTALVDQSANVGVEWWDKATVGVVQGSRKQLDRRMVYVSKDTLIRGDCVEKLLEAGRPSLVIVDEAHLSMSDSFHAAIMRCMGDHTKLLGLTATPDRNDDRRLTDLWRVIYSFGILEGVACGALVPPFAALAPLQGLDTSGVAVHRGEYDREALGRALDQADIIDHVVTAMGEPHVFERLPLRNERETRNLRQVPSVLYWATIKQAQEGAEALSAKGWTARAVWGDMKKADQKRLIKGFGDGSIDVLCNADLLTTGNDIPRIKGVGLCRPFRSWSTYIQTVGRGLRPFPGFARAYVLDFCGSSGEHNVVAAPVLVDGTDCPKGPDGRHQYMAVEGTGGGECAWCPQTVPCFRSRTRQHLFKDGICKHCGEVQCRLSPDGQHKWAPDLFGEPKRVCVHCTMEIPDRLAKLLVKVKVPEKLMWKTLKIPGRSLQVLNLGLVGRVFRDIRPDGHVLHFWRCGVLQPMSSVPVEEGMAELLAESVARRAEKKGGYYGGEESAAAMRKECLQAERVARMLITQGRL